MMDKTCTFNPLNPTTTLNGSNTTSFNPLGCVPETENAVQSLISCDQNGGTKTFLENLANQANNLYGLDILYFRQDFNPKLSHPIYGDQTAPYIGPYLLKAYVKVNSDTSSLTMFGIENTNDIDLQISYEEWQKNIGNYTPQAGDKFEIKDILCNRPSGFTKVTFKVVSQGDSDLFEASKRWFISGQRSDFEWLPNEPREEIDDQIFDDSFTGLVDSVTNLPIEGESQKNALGRDIDELSSENLRNTKSNAYGGFYIDDDDLL